jgi:hypothetical protein
VVKRVLGSSLPPAELARRDSGVFVEIKRLLSIAPKDGKGGKVAGVFMRNTRRTLVSGASDTDVSVWWLTLIRALLEGGVERDGVEATNAGRQCRLDSMSVALLSSATTDTVHVCCFPVGRVY